MKLFERLMNLTFENSKDNLDYFSAFWQSGNCLKPIFMGYQPSRNWRIVQSNGGFILKPRLALFQTKIPFGQKSNGMVREIRFIKIKAQKLRIAKQMLKSIQALLASKSCSVQYGGQKVKLLKRLMSSDVDESVNSIGNLLKKMLTTVHCYYPSKAVTDVYTYVFLLYHLIK